MRSHLKIASLSLHALASRLATAAAVVFVAAVVVGCTTTGAPPAASWCDLNSPIRPTAATFAVMSEDEVSAALSHNRYGQTACGWRPYLNFEWTITFGQALPYIMTFVGIAGAAILGWFVNRVKKVLLEEWAALVEAFKVTTNKTLTDAEKKFELQLADTNRRVSDLAAGVINSDKRHEEFREHAQRTFVEKDEIADLRSSIDKSIERMQNSLELATATMSDVRDSVIALTATNGTTKVPPARRRPPKQGV